MNQRSSKAPRDTGRFSRSNPGSKKDHLARANSRPEAPRRKIVPINWETLNPPETTLSLLSHWPVRVDELKEKLSKFIGFLLETNQLFNLTGDATPEKQWA